VIFTETLLGGAFVIEPEYYRDVITRKTQEATP
jgi:hypothetical protein